MNQINKSELFEDIVLYLGDEYDGKCEKVIKEIISIVCEVIAIAEKHRKIVNPGFCIDYEYALNFSLYAMNEYGMLVDITKQKEPQTSPRLREKLLKVLKKEFYIPITNYSGEGKCCHTCRWYAEFEGVCTNGESKFGADFRCLDDTCPEWMSKESESWKKKI